MLAIARITAATQIDPSSGGTNVPPSNTQTNRHRDRRREVETCVGIARIYILRCLQKWRQPEPSDQNHQQRFQLNFVDPLQTLVLYSVDETSVTKFLDAVFIPDLTGDSVSNPPSPSVKKLCYRRRTARRVVCQSISCQL